MIFQFHNLQRFFSSCDENWTFLYFIFIAFGDVTPGNLGTLQMKLSDNFDGGKGESSIVYVYNIILSQFSSVKIKLVNNRNSESKIN